MHKKHWHLNLVLGLFLIAAPLLAQDSTANVASPAASKESTPPALSSQGGLATGTASKLPSQNQAVDAQVSSLAASSDQKVRVLLVAKEEAMISSRLTGTVKQIHVKESEPFKSGQALVTFDCNELAAEKGVAQAELKLQQTTNKAHTELYAEKVIGALEKDVSQVRVDAAAAKISAYAVKMSNCQILAPFDGQVVELKAHNHETLSSGAPIMLIQNSRNLEAQIHTPSKWMEWVKPGTTFQIFIEEVGKSFPAEVTSLSARVDAVSRTIKIYAKLKGNFPELLPGMSGYAEFNKP